jgi:hypothetical protein
MGDPIRALQLAGRWAHGNKGGRGVKYHAVPARSDTALCGATYGQRSAGWSEHPGPHVTCPRCLSKLRRQAVLIDNADAEPDATMQKRSTP